MSVIDLARLPGAGLLSRARQQLPGPGPAGDRRSDQPLTHPISTGLGPVIEAGVRRAGVPLGPLDPLVGLLGDRWSLTVSEREIHTRGLVGGATVRWQDAAVVELTPMAALLAHQATEVALGRALLVSRLSPVRLVAAKAAEKLAEPIVDDLPWRVARIVDEHVTGDPLVLHAVRRVRGEGSRLLRRGDDVEVGGLISVAVLASSGVTDAVVGLAERHGVPVRTVVPGQSNAREH